MGVIRFFIVFIFFLGAVSLQAQDAYVRHTIQEGETIYTIARRYHITAAEIVRYNPDAGIKLRPGDILIIPQEQC